MTLYIAAAVLLLALGVVTIFSVGLYLIFLALAMLSVVWAHGRRPWIVLGTISGAVAAIASHFLTAPLTCSVVSATSGGRLLSERASCERILLPDLDGLDTSGAHWLALGIALVVGTAVGLIVGGLARRNFSRAAAPT